MTTKEVIERLKIELYRPEVDYYETQKLLNYLKVIEIKLSDITKILTNMIEDEKNGWLDEYNLGQYLDKIVEWLENDK